MKYIYKSRSRSIKALEQQILVKNDDKLIFVIPWSWTVGAVTRRRQQLLHPDSS
jgi:hypothetical protein